MLAPLNVKTAAYIAGYVTKKLLSSDTGRTVPEFLRMSRQPGIGVPAIKRVALASTQSQWLQRHTDVPGSLNHSRTSRLPLGRFLTRKLREGMGLSPDAPLSSKEALADQVRVVQEFAWRNGRRDLKSIWSEINQPYEAKALLKHKLFGGSI